jgi:hypothetical protein
MFSSIPLDETVTFDPESFRSHPRFDTTISILETLDSHEYLQKHFAI